MRLTRGTGFKQHPSPVGGWNARDSLASMKPQDAVFLKNWFPDTSSCKLRKGYTSHATGMIEHVDTLVCFNGAASSKLIAASNGEIWDCTAAGTATSLASGYTNDRWYTDHMNGFLAMCNGEDAPVKYNGSTIASLSTTGPTAANLVGVLAYKSRSYFWEIDSASLWYSAVNALGGTLTEYDLASIDASGGKIMSVQSWSRDAGDGMDDFLVVAMSTGHVLVYQGSSPADSAWALVGKYHTGVPLARNSVVKIGGDLVLMTVDGFIPMSAIMQKGEFARDSAVNDKIREAVKTAAFKYKDNFGWSATYYPESGMGIFNIPIVTNSQTAQYVVNTFTGAWCEFTGMQANAWAVCDGKLYFASHSGVVFQADTGSSDNGSEIEGDALPAFSYMGSPNKKSFTGVHLVLASEGDVPVEIRVDTDFRTPSVDFSSSTYAAAGTAWNAGAWNTFAWTSGPEIFEVKKIVSKTGYSAAARVRVKTSSQSIQWYSTSYIFKKGGIL